MAREILFKAKLADTGKWIVGQRVILCNQTYIIPENQQFRHPGDPDIENSFVEVIPETVCQFTGQIDKNGVKVFESDHDSEGNVVIFCERCAGWQFGQIDIDTKELIIPCHCCDGNFMWNDHISEFEVTGNIHDKTE